MLTGTKTPRDRFSLIAAILAPGWPLDPNISRQNIETYITKLYLPFCRYLILKRGKNGKIKISPFPWWPTLEACIAGVPRLGRWEQNSWAPQDYIVTPYIGRYLPPHRCSDVRTPDQLYYC